MLFQSFPVFRGTDEVLKESARNFVSDLFREIIHTAQMKPLVLRRALWNYVPRVVCLGKFLLLLKV
jgi:hypothetical protein